VQPSTAAAAHRARLVVIHVGGRLRCGALVDERPGIGRWTATCVGAALGAGRTEITGFAARAQFDERAVHFAMAAPRTLVFGDRWLVSAPPAASELVLEALSDGRAVSVATG
jgi:hypothetical protein